MVETYPKLRIVSLFFSLMLMVSISGAFTTDSVAQTVTLTETQVTPTEAWINKPTVQTKP